MKVLANGVAVIDGDSHHGVWCATEGLIHDRFMADVLLDLVQDFNVSMAVDGGANIGTLTAALLQWGVSVHAFEPNPQALECLSYNCPEAAIHPVGLAAQSETRMLLRESNAGASFILDRHSEIFGQAVKLETLDSFNLEPGLIKLDVEGFEVEALRGAEQTIRRFRPVLVCEVNDMALHRAGYSPGALYSTLADFGYKTEIVQPDCQLDSPQYDIIARP